MNDPTPARDALLRRLQRGRERKVSPQDMALVDAFAHELADQIRSAQDATDTYMMAGDAADLIDPEAQQ